MVKALFDTNILIDFLNAVPQARDEISRFRHKAISIVTWMEVMAAATSETEPRTRGFLEAFEIVPVGSDVAERAVALRRSRRLKLPDAVILASADVFSMLLVTRNTKDFGSDAAGVRVPYSI